MSVQAEIKTGKRRIIQYLLSPISQAAQEYRTVIGTPRHAVPA